MDQAKSQQAPGGVLVLAILEYLAGAFFLILGILSFFRTDAFYHVTNYNGYAARGVVIATSHPLLAILLLVIGIIHLILGDGLWEGRHWAYLWVIVFSILYIVFGIFEWASLGYVGYISLILNIIIILYLTASSDAKSYLT